MADMLITPTKLQGSVKVPASKSLCHRAIICAGLADATSPIEGVGISADIRATIAGMQALGASVQLVADDKLLVTGCGGVYPREDMIDCGESGSTLRFLIPLALLANRRMTFTGRGRLCERPIDDYAAICQQQSIAWQSAGGLPLTVQGLLQPGEYNLRGDVSSQFITGLLLALPLLPGDSVIRLTTPLESKGYVDLTLATQAEFGVTVTHQDYREFHVPGRQAYKASRYRVEGDYSQAAFWLVAGTIGTAVSCEGLQADSLQGDKVIVSLIRQAGGVISEQATKVTASAGRTYGREINAADCPDLVPILAVLASVSNGTTRIINAGRLRLKESDRLAAISQELGRLGADIRADGDSLTIHGKQQLTGGEVDSWGDHRIAMALAIASIRCERPVLLHGSECVSKSYPRFWQDFVSLGGVIHERSVG